MEGVVTPAIVPPPSAVTTQPSLDDPSRLSRLDPQGALADVERAADQWQAARRVAVPEVDVATCDSVVIVGLGGSGVVGDIAVHVARDRSRRPIQVSRERDLPAHVGPDTLVVACSHSGGTAEVIAAARQAAARGARLVAISGGGPLAELARADGHWVPAATDCPPRHSLGALLVPLLRLLECADGLDEAIDALTRVAQLWGRRTPTSGNTAKMLGAALADGRLPIVFGGVGVAQVAAQRLRTQLNENAKLPALTASLPELAHNEIVAWEHPGPLAARARLVWLRDPEAEAPADAVAFDHVRALVAQHDVTVHEIHAHGTHVLARLASLLATADLTSVYAALARGVDPSPTESIARLKATVTA